MTRYVCPACGSYKTKKVLLCVECLEIYGAQNDWPEWLSVLVSENNREYISEYRRAKREIPLDEEFLEDGEPLYFGEAKDYTTVRYPRAGDGVLISLPNSPYDNEEDNIRYRKANGIG